MDSGIFPLISFKDKSRYVRFLSLPIPIGILPEILLVLKSSLVSAIKFSIDAGNDPDNRFSEKPNSNRNDNNCKL